jgi:DNA repair protein SbcD/Mre11
MVGRGAIDGGSLVGAGRDAGASSVRLLHTSDWHLGHTLAELSREHEHAAFLAWLEATLESEAVDALLVTGDVFDASNPPASAERTWFDFLARLKRRLPRLQVVVIGGNHDSAARLEAPRALLDGLAVHVVGGLPRHDGGGLDLDRLLVPLVDARGRPAALVAAVPFLRPADLPPAADDDPLIGGVRAIYREVLAAAHARLGAGQALVATGHLYMTGGALSELSERRILGGNQHALPHDLFPAELAYVALGHLHRAQRVGRDQVRYAGSPLPLSLDEASYRHSVALVELDGAGPASVRTVPVPRAIDVVRVPARGSASIEAIEAALAALEPLRPDDAARPYLSVHVALPAPVPDLRRRIDAALVGRRPRLCRVVAAYPGDGRALAEASATPELRDLDPAEVLRRKWRRDHDGEPPAELVALFAELVEEVKRGDGAGGRDGAVRIERTREARA